MEESTVRCVWGEDCHRLSTRKNLEGDYLFCSVPAVTHYTRDTVQFLEEAGVDTLKRDDNPPNVPQLRPIEDFWGVMKQEVYRGGWVGHLKQN